MSKLPGLGAPLGPGPIQEDLHGLMNAVAKALDEHFNGPNCPPEGKRVWFFLAAGNFAEGELPRISRFNYISNADKLDIREALRAVLGRLEDRIAGGGQT